MTIKILLSILFNTWITFAIQGSFVQTFQRWSTLSSLKGCLTALNPEHKIDSPLIGVSMRNIIKNLSHFGNRSHATTNLINHPDFGLYTSDSDQNSPHQSVTLRPSLPANLVGKIITLMHTDARSLYKEITEELYAAHNTTIDTQESLVKNHKTTDTFKRFLDTCLESRNESGDYPAFYPYGIITSTLPIHKPDIVSYLKTLHHTLGACKGTHTKFGRLSKSTFNPEEFIGIEKYHQKENISRLLDNDSLFERYISSTVPIDTSSSQDETYALHETRKALIEQSIQKPDKIYAPVLLAHLTSDVKLPLNDTALAKKTLSTELIRHNILSSTLSPDILLEKLVHLCRYPGLCTREYARVLVELNTTNLENNTVKKKLYLIAASNKNHLMIDLLT
jgi:hypothetical protein